MRHKDSESNPDQEILVCHSPCNTFSLTYVAAMTFVSSGTGIEARRKPRYAHMMLLGASYRTLVLPLVMPWCSMLAAHGHMGWVTSALIVATTKLSLPLFLLPLTLLVIAAKSIFRALVGGWRANVRWGLAAPDHAHRGRPPISGPSRARLACHRASKPSNNMDTCF